MIDAFREVARFVKTGAGLAIDAADLVWSRKTGRPPKSLPVLMIEITRKCNLSCKYCGFRFQYPDRGTEMTHDELIEILNQAATLRTRIVSFGGGEAFLRPDMTTLLTHAESLGMAPHVDSNGTLVDSALARELGRLKGLTMIFSLDSANPEINDEMRGQGTFDAVKNAVVRLREFAPKVAIGINTVVGPHSLSGLTELVETVHGWGVDSVKFFPVHANLAHRWKEIPVDVLHHPHATPTEVMAAVDHAAKRARSLKLHTVSDGFVAGIKPFLEHRPGVPCWSGWISGTIDPFGRLLPCYEFIGDIDVRQIGLVAAWRGPEMQELRQRVRTCSIPCWCPGYAEPSLHLNPSYLIRQPTKLLEDIALYLR